MCSTVRSISRRQQRTHVSRRADETPRGASGVSNAEFAIPALDDLLRGMYWGENVCWKLGDDSETNRPFAAAVVAALTSSPSFDRVYTIATDPTPAGADQIDPAAPSSTIVATLRRAIADGSSPLVAVDLDELRKVRVDSDFEAFVADIAQASLLNGFIAHWFGTAGDELAGIESLAQCVIEVGTTSLRVSRADGRSTHTRGALLPYHLAGGRIEVESPSVTALLGRGLRGIRHDRGWSQSQLGDLIGISGSAISQAERGQHALSLESMVELTDKLGLSIDQLLRGRAPSYELTRATGPAHLSPTGPTRFLVDDAALRVRTVLTRISPRGAASPGLDADAAQILLVGQGLVQVILPADRPILRQGDGLLVRSGGIISCRNLGEHEAIVFIHEHS
ncbi:MAG: hypothetical protein C0482_22620 [Gordonia sp.]|nr:hypothetical protein [Gordonia sp. (in: high G+C Gram-positive bacteria)]